MYKFTLREENYKDCEKKKQHSLRKLIYDGFDLILKSIHVNGICKG